MSKAGGPWSGDMTCCKCGDTFYGHRFGSWDWQPKMCKACNKYEFMLKLQTLTVRDRLAIKHFHKFLELCNKYGEENLLKRKFWQVYCGLKVKK